MQRLLVSARLRLVSTDAGGRTTGIRSNYRPTFDLGSTWQGLPTLNDGRVVLVDREELAPGDEGTVTIEPLFPDDPHIAANRRVTITLMREAPPLPVGFKP